MEQAFKLPNKGASGLINREIARPTMTTGSPTTFDENILPKEKLALLAAVDYLAKLDDNWTGYRAEPPTLLARQITRHFIKLLPLNKCHAQKIEPDGEGGIVMHWTKPGERILLTLDGSMAHLSHETTGQAPEFYNEIPFFDTQDAILPDAILKHIPLR